MIRKELPDILYLEDGTELRKTQRSTGYYAGSNGIIYTNKCGGLKPMKSRLDRQGYPRICIYINGVGKTVFVHQLIAEEFLEKPEGTTEINHKDGIKTNNMPSNLEWVTPSQNGLHAYRTGLHGPSGFVPHINKVVVTDLITGETEIIRSVSECARRLGCTQSNISHAIPSGSICKKRYRVEFINNGGK